MKNKTLLLIFILLFSVSTSLSHTYASQEQLSETIIKSQPKSSLKELVNTSDLIVYSTLHSTYKKIKTKRSLADGDLYNYLQGVDIKKILKGSTDQKISILSTGIEPLPKPDNPLNKIYPGPLSYGNYVVFLKKVNNSTTHYYINGGWQGTYPYINGHFISLKQAGFDVLNGLNIKEFSKKIKGLAE